MNHFTKVPSTVITSDRVVDMRESWLVCLSAGLFFFYVFFQMNIFDVINQNLRQTFQINAVQLSWMSSSFVLASIFFLFQQG